MKKFFPWKFNLEYSGTFTKLLMHVSSRNMFPTIRNLQIRVHVYCPRLSVVLFRWLPIMTLWRKDKQSWMLRQARTHSWQWLLRNLSVSCRVNHFLCVQLFWCGTHGIYFYLHPTFFSSTEQYAWAIISPKESNLGSHAYHLHYCTRKQNYLLTNILRFALKICFWADF